MAPNMRAVERLGVVQDRLKTTDRDFEDARKRAKRAKDDFQTVKEQRFELFSKAFSHISEQIGPIYKDLTRDASLPMGGQAYEIPGSSRYIDLIANNRQISGHGRRRRTLSRRYQISRHATLKAIPRHGASFWG